MKIGFYVLFLTMLLTAAIPVYMYWFKDYAEKSYTLWRKRNDIFSGFNVFAYLPLGAYRWTLKIMTLLVLASAIYVIIWLVTSPERFGV